MSHSFGPLVLVVVMPMVVMVPVVVVPVMMMPMVPVMPMMMVPVAMVPMVMVMMMMMPVDLYGLQTIDLILSDHGGPCAVGARRHQGLFGRDRR
jgi:hypothetical protein